ncbi:hypothetical protein EJ04DRAFT_40260 [Polyplosphaeria fusca]|uniref:Secreted protein n=1 Tax=Polyplosphaeria fusca TaxID=682080 RepID=A0A9P4V599_9PLEO|nr:hypothetical protein EJ04DRAFT_40260 [Polyplosphaeria fusca]
MSNDSLCFCLAFCKLVLHSEAFSLLWMIPRMNFSLFWFCMKRASMGNRARSFFFKTITADGKRVFTIMVDEYLACPHTKSSHVQ